MSKGKLIVISGPSGVGKGTALKLAMSRRPGLAFSVSATTRPPRPDETEGKSYFFVTEPQFRQMIDRGEFLEYDAHNKALYGTLWSQIENRGEGDILLDIDPMGAKKVRERVPEAVLIFVMPPSVQELERQLDDGRRGIALKRYGDHLRLETRPEYAPYVERLLQPVQRQSLSQTVMETLAVIAYRQPATKGEVEQIRGVKCDYSIQSLLNKGLIKEVGRKEALGRPILYATTDRFLEHFGLSDIRELPPLPQGAVSLDPGLPAEGGQGA